MLTWCQVRIRAGASSRNQALTAGHVRNASADALMTRSFTESFARGSALDRSLIW